MIDVGQELRWAYKGFFFAVDDSTQTIIGGRDVQVQQIPFAKKQDSRNPNYTNVQDLGYSGKQFKFTAVFGGDNRLFRLSRFIYLMDEGGQGTLIIPFLGSYQVYAGSYTVENTYTSSGLTKVECSFYEGKEDNVTSFFSDVGSVVNGISGAFNSAKGEFDKIFHFPEESFQHNRIISSIKDQLGFFASLGDNDVKNFISSIDLIEAEVSSSVSQLYYGIFNILNDVEKLSNSSLFDAIEEGISSIPVLEFATPSSDEGNQVILALHDMRNILLFCLIVRAYSEDEFFKKNDVHNVLERLKEKLSIITQTEGIFTIPREVIVGFDFYKNAKTFYKKYDRIVRSEAYASLEIMYKNAVDYFVRIFETLANIVTTKQKGETGSVLFCYMATESLADLEKIRNINSNVSDLHYSGELGYPSQ